MLAERKLNLLLFFCSSSVATGCWPVPYLLFTIHTHARARARRDSQALAGFGIAASAAPGASQATGGDDVFMAFSEGGRASGDLSSSASIQGGVLGGGGGGLKGERDRVSSVDVADLLRATRLRGGGRRASRPAVRERERERERERQADRQKASYTDRLGFCW